MLGTPERWWGMPLRCLTGLGQRAPSAASPTGGCVGSGWQQQWLLITLGGGQPSLGIGTPAERNLAAQAGSSGSSANRALWTGSGSWGPQDAGGTFRSELRELGPTPFRPVLPPGPLPSLPGVCAGCLLCVLVFIWSRAGSGTWSPSCSEEMGVGGSLVFPQDNRMALGQETMGPGRGQVLCPGQEKDDLKINTARPWT